MPKGWSLRNATDFSHHMGMSWKYIEMKDAVNGKGTFQKKRRVCNKGELVYELPISGVVYSKTTCMVLGIARSKPCSLRLRLWSKKRRGSEMNRRDRTSLWSDWSKGLFSTRWQEYGFRHVFPTSSESQTQYHHVSHEIKLHMPRFSKAGSGYVERLIFTRCKHHQKSCTLPDSYSHSTELCQSGDSKIGPAGKIAINHHFQRVTFWLFNYSYGNPPINGNIGNL